MLTTAVFATIQYITIALAIAGQASPPATRPATISGRVLTISGQPVSDVRVVAIVAEEGSGTTQLSMMSLARTDSEGRYRLEDVAPGAYYIAAGPLDDLTYFPGVNFTSKATAIKVPGGAALSDVSFRLTTPLPVEVSGRVVNDAGLPIFAGIPLTIEPLGAPASRPVLVNRSTAIAADGTFRFVVQRPGPYRAYVPTGGPEAVFMVEDRNITGLEIRATTVRHTIRVEDGGPLPVFDLVFTDARITGAPQISRVGVANSAEAMRSGEFRVTARGLPPAFIVKSITAHGVDLSNQTLRVGDSPGPLEIDLVLGLSPSSAWARLSGVLTGPGARSATEVVLKNAGFREDLKTRPSPDGAFAFPKLWDGAYTLTVWADGALSAIVAVDVRGDKSLEIAPHSMREVAGRLTVEPNAPLPLTIDFDVDCPASAETARLSLRTTAEVGPDGSFKAMLPEKGCRLAVKPDPTQHLFKRLTYRELDLTTSLTSFISGAPEPLEVILVAAANNMVRVRGVVTSNIPSLKRIILQPPTTPGARLLPTDGRRALQFPIAADGSFEALLPPGRYPVYVNSDVLPNVPMPELFLTIDSTQTANPVPVTLAITKMRKVTIHAITDNGGKTPEAFILRMDGSVRSGLQFFGFSTNVVTSPDPAFPDRGTYSMILPEGAFGLGIDFPEGMVRPPRVKSVTASGGLNLMADRLSITDSDVEITVVFETPQTTASPQAR